MILDYLCNLEAGSNADGFQPIAATLAPRRPEILQLATSYSYRNAGGYAGSVALALAQYNNAPWTSGALPISWAGYQSSKEVDTSTDRTYYSNTTEADASYQFTGLQYQFTVTLSMPWSGSGAIRIYWRLRTDNQSSVLRLVGFTPPYEVFSAAATQSYGHAMTEDLTPEPGATVVQGAVHTIDPTGLNLGDQVYVVGPPDLRWITPFFSARAASSSAAKLGYLSYIRPGNPDGGTTNPQPVYQIETASVTPGTHPTIIYSGYQSALDVSLGFDNVPEDSGSFVASKRNSPVSLPYYFAGDNDNAVGNRAKALGLQPTIADWPRGLRMTLSSESTTADLRALVDPTVSLLPIPADGRPVAAGYVPPGILVAAWRSLPAHEQTYSAGKSVYSVGAYVPINSGVKILYAPIQSFAATGTLSLAWSRLTLDLDTGIFSDPEAMQFTLSFVGDPSSPGFTASTSPAGCAPNGLFTSPYYLEDVPATNRRVSLYGLAWPPGATLECLDIGPQAEIIAAGG